MLCSLVVALLLLLLFRLFVAADIESLRLFEYYVRLVYLH